MPDFVDLHIHTNHSDGRHTPREVVDCACAVGLKAIAVTDHDTVSGYLESAAYGSEKGLEVIAGIELSAAKTDDDTHILGYLFRPDHPRLLTMVERFKRIRMERGRKMIRRLAKLGLKIDYAEVLAAADGAPVGRPHLAQVMLAHGFVDSYDDAFNKYLGLKGPVYIPKAKLTPADAIDLIHEAGGVAVMAHPFLTDRDEMIEELAAAGLDGLEIYHPTQQRPVRKRYRRLAGRLGLICTGGSDAHTRQGRCGEIGHEKVPYECLEQLKIRRQTYAGRQ